MTANIGVNRTVTLSTRPLHGVKDGTKAFSSLPRVVTGLFIHCRESNYPGAISSCFVVSSFRIGSLVCSRLVGNLVHRYSSARVKRWLLGSVGQSACVANNKKVQYRDITAFGR